MSREVWSLHSSYKDGGAEYCGVFDSPRAMAVGLARRVHGDHQEDSREDLVDVIALAVFNMFYHDKLRPWTVSEECRDGYTVYGYDVDEVQSLGEKKEEDKE